MRNALPLTGLAAVLLLACSGGPERTGTEPPSPYAGTPPPERTEGAYELTSTFEPSLLLLAPDPIEGTVDALTGLSTEPAATLFELAELAGVPAVGTLRDALPGWLENELYDALDRYLLEAIVNETPYPAAISSLAADVAAFGTTFDLVTRLELGTPGAAGDTTARHTVVAVIFTPLSAARITVPALLAGAAGDDTLSASVREILAESGLDGDAHLLLGEHAFGLPFGDYVITAIDLLAAAELGATDLRDALGRLVGCPALAASLAARCFAGVCVGHEAELAAVCEAGLDAAVDQIHGRIRALDLNAVHFLAGEATMHDAASPAGATDGTADLLTDGVWEANLAAGLGDRATPAEFTGLRLPE